MTEDLRRQDAIAHALPDDVRRAVDAFDPDREAAWLVGPYIGTAPIDGRAVVGGRPDAWTALEDKLVADQIWDAVGGARASGARLWTLGPLLRGVFWECTAVPDIRHQAVDLARAVAAEFA